jgi:hypothetical protein
MNIKTILQWLGKGALLFVLLILGGWAFVAGIGVLFALAYRKNKNRGSLLAAASFLGLGLGLLIELLLGREGGVAIMPGIAFALLAMVFVLWRDSQTISYWAIALSLGLVLTTAVLWSSSPESLSLYLALFPFGILALLALAAYQFWRYRTTLLLKNNGK